MEEKLKLLKDKEKYVRGLRKKGEKKRWKKIKERTWREDSRDSKEK